MIKKICATFFACALQLSCLMAQKQVKEEASVKIKAHDYTGANSYLDSVLATDPKCVDALMMKGNVILNEAFSKRADIELRGTDDESIYDQTIGTIDEPEKYLDKEPARKVEQLWLKCLQINPGRIDIHQGLCTVYGIAMMKDEMLKELPKLIKEVKAAGGIDDNFIYGLEDYGQAFLKRDNFDACMEVYKLISSAFPDAGGLLCDEAVMYQHHGKINESVMCAHKALTKKHNDFLTDYSATALIAIGENIPAANQVFTSLGADSKNTAYKYYQSLFRFYNGDKSWAPLMKDFARHYKAQEADDPRLAVAKIMSAENFQLDSANFAAIQDIRPYELELLLITSVAKEQLANKYLPLKALADLYNNKLCYLQALAILDEMKRIPMSPAQDSSYHFKLAYTQYQNNKKAESVETWKMLLASGDFFRQSAACYFTGKALLEEGKKDEAKALFSRVADRPSESKFANYCSYELDKLK
jgi:hypothetical protein